MNTKTVPHLEFAPPAQAGTGRAWVVAGIVHVLLFLALGLATAWKTQPQTVQAEAELWSATPQAAAPRLQEPPPEPQPEPVPEPTPAPPAKPTPPPPPAPDPALELRDAQIALEKKKQQEKKKEADKVEKLKAEKLKVEKEKAEKEKAEKFDKVFNQHFTKALEQLPEFDGVVNKEVIKTLSLNPANANKTFTQLIEEAYGHLVSGKRTLDVANSRNSRLEAGEVDVKRANTDIEYFREIKSNPHLLKKYNEMISKDLFGKM